MEGVSVFLAVGFRERPTKEDDGTDAQYRKEDAGWSIVCNGRVVLPYDRTKLTGWGWAGVPNYHNQFIAISGYVVFDGDPKRLPMTTTKRGVDANSAIFISVRERMQQGLKHFTKFTNDWKGLDTGPVFKAAKPITIAALHSKAKKQRLTTVRDGKQMLPSLPSKPRDSADQRITFMKRREEVDAVSRFLFGDEEKTPSQVGEGCFDYVHRQSER